MNIQVQGPKKNQNNIQILTKSYAKKVIIEDKKAIGVEYYHKGQTKIVRVNREVILSAGALLSPQLLQLSGIGPAPLLKSHNIEVVHHLPDVGQHLKDHLGIDHTLLVNQPSLNQVLRPLHGKIRVGLEYIFKRTGPLSMSVNQGGGFVKSDPSLKAPDLQLYFSPLSYSVAPNGKRPMMSPDPFAAVRLGFNPCKSTSEGSVEIKSKDAFVAPKFLVWLLSPLLGVKRTFIKKNVGYDFYLPRVDKVVLGSDALVAVMVGESSTKPVPPSTVDNTMELGTISLPAYLYDPDDAKITLTDNVRFTMRDIGKIEDRVSNLEEITSLLSLIHI